MSAVPQILFPTFIAELERPQDTPKALTVLAGMSGFPFHRPSSYGLPIPIDRGLNSLPFALTQSTNALHRPLFTTTLHQPLFIDHSLLTTLHRPLFTNYSAINPQQDSLADHSSSTYLTNLPYTCTIQLRTLTKNEAQNLTLDAIIAMKLITSILSSLGIGMLALSALAGGATIPPTPTTLAAKSHDSRSEKRDTPWKCTKNRDGLEICKDGSCVQGPRCGEHQICVIEGYPDTKSRCKDL